MPRKKNKTKTHKHLFDQYPLILWLTFLIWLQCHDYLQLNCFRLFLESAVIFFSTMLSLDWFFFFQFFIYFSCSGSGLLYMLGTISCPKTDCNSRNKKWSCYIKKQLDGISLYCIHVCLGSTLLCFHDN